jgi:transcriptional regulator with XRE-family HTH domain
MDIGNRVKSLRKQKSLSQTELAKRLGIDQSLISYLESGKGMGSSHIASLALVLGVNAHWLETGQGSPELNYVPPVVVNKTYCKEIEEAIRLMEAADDRGRIKMLIALQDALEHHKAFQASLPLPRQVSDLEADRIEQFAARRLGEELLAKTSQNEALPSDAYIIEKNSAARKDKRH